ncbi:hypothetical protein [Spirochaeta dissipatitropha]
MKKISLAAQLVLVLIVTLGLGSCSRSISLQPAPTAPEPRHVNYIVITEEYAAARESAGLDAGVSALLRYGEVFEVSERQVVPAVVQGIRGFWFRILIEVGNDIREAWVFDSSFSGFASFPEAELYARFLAVE